MPLCQLSSNQAPEVPEPGRDLAQGLHPERRASLGQAGEGGRPPLGTAQVCEGGPAKCYLFVNVSSHYLTNTQLPQAITVLESFWSGVFIRWCATMYYYDSSRCSVT